MIPKTRIILASILVSLLLGLILFLLAGNTGKIAGIVKDKNTGEPLIGANVLIEGTNLGASTDADGTFFIIGVPPGTYNVKCMYIGYHTLTIKEVFVKVDLTTRLEIELETEAFEGEEVEVVAKREIIQKDVTSTSRLSTSEDILKTPGIQSVTDVLSLTGCKTPSIAISRWK